ncbi:MAG: hypothetical protein EOP08_17050 [Proteobacteria bacterium]|nr:MAG: hypothetical protein EOP08_17050 [Pseudomonadota bacterium]
MVQSMAPRPGRPTTDPADPDADRDNVAFREYDTYAGDLQYACTFPLAAPLDAKATIDCQGSPTNPSDSPLCEPGDRTKNRAQLRAKAYPTIREAWLVRELASQGVLGSLCPRETQGEETSAAYGYNPVVNEIVDRLANAITASCLPRALERSPVDDTVPCLMLEVLPEGMDCAGDGREIGRSVPEKEVLDAFRSRLELPATRAVCRLEQDASARDLETCQAGTGGWCYLDDEAGRCEQRIVFNDAVLARAKGSRVYMQCISDYSASAPEPAALP